MSFFPRQKCREIPINFFSSLFLFRVATQLLPYCLKVTTKAKARITHELASAPPLRQDRALRSAFPAKPLLCLPLPAQPPAPVAVTEPSSTRIDPGTKHTFGPTVRTRRSGSSPLPPSLLALHPPPLPGLWSPSNRQRWTRTTNSWELVSRKTLAEVIHLWKKASFFQFNHKQLK